MHLTAKRKVQLVDGGATTFDLAEDGKPIIHLWNYKLTADDKDNLWLVRCLVGSGRYPEGFEFYTSNIELKDNFLPFAYADDQIKPEQNIRFVILNPSVS